MLRLKEAYRSVILCELKLADWNCALPSHAQSAISLLSEGHRRALAEPEFLVNNQK